MNHGAAGDIQLKAGEPAFQDGGGAASSAVLLLTPYILASPGVLRECFRFAADQAPGVSAAFRFLAGLMISLAEVLP